MAGDDMEVTILESFINPESMILIPVLYLIGLFLDQTPKVPAWSTPWIKVFVGVVFCLAYYGMIIEAVVQGILVAGAAVLMRDLIHKSIDAVRENHKNNKK